MKLNKYTALAVAAAAALTACSEMDELVPQGGSALAEQVKETNMLSLADQRRHSTECSRRSVLLKAYSVQADLMTGEYS